MTIVLHEVLHEQNLMQHNSFIPTVTGLDKQGTPLIILTNQLNNPSTHIFLLPLSLYHVENFQVFPVSSDLTPGGRTLISLLPLIDR